jgi:predicted dehydrogenase
MKTRYAIAGASARAAEMFCEPIERDYGDVAEVVGVMDINRRRMEALNSYLRTPVPMFTDFAQMIHESNPDAVIVTTKDSYHHKYIIAALEAGIDAITEKPMTIDAEKCRAILDAEKRTGRKVTVTFNYRHTPLRRRIKEILLQGRIGDILSVDFHWYLDTSHGADYFRRWHRRMENSGGLLVHKATHHFDLVNWLTDSEPEVVYAQGKLRFYGPRRNERGERCLTCEYKNSCEFYIDLTTSERAVRFYLEAEQEDGYIRDACVFSPEIDIYDTMSVTVGYRNGMQLSYSLIAHAPYEGWRLSFNGTKGRMDVMEVESWPDGASSLGLAGGLPLPGEHDRIYLYPHFGPVEVIKVPKAAGGHGGGDAMIQRALFRGMESDPLKLQADSWSGAMSVLIGVAANESITAGNPVRIADLLGGPECR